MVVSESVESTFSRRSFIKGAAAVAASGVMAGGLLAGCQPKAQSSSGSSSSSSGASVVIPETKIFAGVCRGNCDGGCFLDVHVREGKVVRTTARDMPDTKYNRICARGVTQPGRIYSDERLKYPMRRTGKRGSGEFERISWDEAIKEIAEKWMSYTKEFGPNSMAMFTGSGNFAVCNGVGFGSASARFRNIVGASAVPTNVDAAVGRMAGIVTGMNLYGNNNGPDDYLNSKTFICWGSSPTISQPQIMHFILEAKERGTKYIVIDPAYNANTAKADWHIPVNPSTDGALAFGVLVEILAQGWIDAAFLRSSTEAPFLVKEDGKLLRMSDLGVKPIEGDVNPATGKPTIIDPIAVWDEVQNEGVAIGEAKTPALENIPLINGLSVKTQFEIVKEAVSGWTIEKASELSGVPVDSIKELARVYAQDGPVNTYTLFGCNHYLNGHYNYWPIWSIGLLTGNCGKLGAGLGYAMLRPMTMNFTRTLYPVDSAGTRVQGPGMTFLINQMNNVLDNNSFAGNPVTLKGVYIANTNPMCTMAQWNETYNFLSRVEFLVVADMCMTETATYADILLPVAHWFEAVDLFTSYGTSPYILWQEKCVEPLFESKGDFQIYKLLCEAMGYGEYWNITEEDYIDLLLDTDAVKAMGLSLDQMKNEKVGKYLPGEPFISFDGGIFTTPSGRARFYQETVTPDYNIGQTIDISKERTLYWEPAWEADVNSPVRQTHPFFILSEHMRTRTHSQFWDVGYLKEYEREPVVKINPKDASEYGILDGDKVRVFNDRGSVVMKAVLQPGLPQKMLASPRSFHAKEFIEGHFSSISTNQFNPINANQSFNDVAVSIAKV